MQFTKEAEQITQARQRAFAISEHCRKSRCGACQFHTNTCVFMHAVPGVPAYWNVLGFDPISLDNIQGCVQYLQTQQNYR